MSARIGALRCSLALAALAGACTGLRADGPAMQAAGPVQYACGGVGAEERQQMKALASGASVELLFVTEKRGGYLAEVAFTVVDEKGASLLQATADGPICLLRLPAGRYRVSAALDGATRSASVGGGASGKPQRVALAFPGEKWDGIRASDEEKRQARE